MFKNQSFNLPAFNVSSTWTYDVLWEENIKNKLEVVSFYDLITC